jgi:hypothetical protein
MNTQLDSIELVDLFPSGFHWLQYLAKEKKRVRYSDWKRLIKSARPNDSSLNDSRLLWLWECITTEPGTKIRLGEKIVSLDDEWKKSKKVEALPPKSKFGIFFKAFQSFGYPTFQKIKNVQPDAEAEILEALFLRPGKSHRLECCDVKTLLRIHLSQKSSIEQESLLFKVEEKDVKILGNTVEVSAKSLNHAFTKASLRLQPHRRGHGGKAYHHVALKLIKNLYEPLEEIRKKNEEIIWKQLKGG